MAAQKQAEDNVLQFPVRRSEGGSESPAPQKPTPTPKGSKKTWLNEKARPAIIALIAVFGVSWFGNRFAPQSTELSSVSGRVIASLDDHGISATDRDASWERDFAKELSNHAGRRLASVKLGHRPSLEERLRFDVLQGQYAVVFRDGKLAEVRLPAAAQAGSIYLKDGARFVKEHRGLMPVEFATVVAENRQASGEGVFETYSLLADDKTKVGEVRIGFDPYGRLLNLTVANSMATR